MRPRAPLTFLKGRGLKSGPWGCGPFFTKPESYKLERWVLGLCPPQDSPASLLRKPGQEQSPLSLPNPQQWGDSSWGPPVVFLPT